MRELSTKTGRQCLRWIAAALLGCFMTVGVPALSAQWVGATPESVVQAPVPKEIQEGTPESLLQAGIQHYEAEQFAAALDVWNRAVEVELDTVNRALLLSNLSLAHQHLGQWDQAADAISASLDLLGQSEGQTDAHLATLAKALNTQGRFHWARGNLETALESWRGATAAYREAGDVRGTVLSLINQAKVLQTLGLHVRANEMLGQVDAALQTTSLAPEVQASGLWHLGVASRRIGELPRSLAALQASLEITDRFQDQFRGGALRSQILLALGNTQRALGESAIATNQLPKAEAYQTKALAAYQQASIAASPGLNKLQADLNQLSLLIEMKQRSEALALWPTLPPMLQALPLSRGTIYARLNFAKSLVELKGEGGKAKGKRRRVGALHATPVRGWIRGKGERRRAKGGNYAQGAGGQEPDWLEVGEFLGETLQQARALKDPIAESYATGQLGALYELTGQWSQALALTQAAIQKTEMGQHLEGRYRWEWQLGRLLKAQGEKDSAIKAYNTAVTTLSSVRDNLRFIDSELQFSFRDDVEPVYRELVELLLDNSSDEDGVENLDETALRQIIQRVNDLQLKELENFLSCNLSPSVQIGQAVDPTAAIVYPIILEDQLAVILELPGEARSLRVHQIQQPREAIEATLQQLRRDLSEAPSRTPEVTESAKTVYSWLIAPFESMLAQQEQIKTLVFVLDGALRNIPMAVLYDGEQYLIEKYAIAIAPGLDLISPQPLPQDLTAFTGGIGEPQIVENREFSEIEKLEEELTGIGQWVSARPPLLNAQFTRENLQQQIEANDFSVIHLKTHGLFSSVPDETFIVAYQELIRGRDLGSLIQSTSRPGRSPIELLILSACSTAQGDNRAVLGLAGVAVQSGARSTVSTLWEAQDTPNTQMMIQFYQELAKPGISRAQALQNAQLALMKGTEGRSGYAAPHIWATYVLVGNWL